ncbi:MAG: FG-GAP-like repeat-containing protein [Myxococcota bacterium]
MAPADSAHAVLAVPVARAIAGPCALEVRAFDRAGLVATATAETSVDLSAPEVGFAPAAPTLRPGASWVDARLTDALGGPDLGATAATVTAIVDGALVPIEVTVVDPALRIDLRTAGAEGVATVTVTPIDVLGNVGAPASIDVALDLRAPELVTADPALGATNVAAFAPLTLTFDEPIFVQPGQLVVTVLGAPALGTTSAAGRSVTFAPAAPWPSEALVSASLAGARDVVGNVIAPTTTWFIARPYAFIDVTPRSPGLDGYRGDTGETGENHGPGGVFADVDGDGFPDLVLGPGPGEPLVVWRNVPADDPPGRRFTPVPIRAGALHGSTGALVADVDNDGDQDLFVGQWRGPDELWRNHVADTGELAFDDITPATAPPGEPGLAFSRDGGDSLDMTMAAAFADVDRDGRLDLYVGHHNGHYRSPQRGDKPGQRNTLYRQNADGTFSDITMAAGVPGWSTAAGLYDTTEQHFSSTDAVLFTDLDDDRWPDLIVTNKMRTYENRQMVYHNRGAAPDGSWRGFEVLTYTLGPDFGDDDPLAMGIDCNDLDNDGDLDFYITDWTPFGTVPGPNDPWLNRFADVHHIDFQTNLPWARGVYSWGVQLQDFDNDGHVDIHVASNTGEYDLLYMAHRGTLPGNIAGWVDQAASADLRQRQDSRGDMSADLDRDGWVDLVVVNLDAPPRVYWNRWQPRVGPGHHWLSIALTGDPGRAGPYRSSRDAIGARVVAHADIDGDGVVELLAREVRSGSSNAVSTSSLELELGLGVATTVGLEVRWPSGASTWLPGVAVDQHLAVSEPP